MPVFLQVEYLPVDGSERLQGQTWSSDADAVGRMYAEAKARPYLQLLTMIDSRCRFYSNSVNTLALMRF